MTEGSTFPYLRRYDHQIVGKYIFIAKFEFDQMPDYSATIPTGAFVGKMWKRKEPYCGTHADGSVKWFVGHYTDHPDKTKVGIRWYDVQLISEKTELE